MWLIVVQDDAGKWMSEPKLIKESWTEAKAAQERMAAQTPNSLVVVMYEMAFAGAHIGDMEE